MPSKKLKEPVRPDRYYHIYNRGNNKEKIFYHSSDYYFFMGKYKQFIAPYADTYAYCLLPNHFHFLIKTRNEDQNGKSVIPNQLRKLFITYALRINFNQKRTGGLFTKSYQRIEIKDEEHLHILVNYIHKNPIKHGVHPDFESYPYSSFKSLVLNEDSFLSGGSVYEWFGGINPFVLYHYNDPIDPKTFSFLNVEPENLDANNNSVNQGWSPG
jgi:putative transposase